MLVRRGNRAAADGGRCGRGLPVPGLPAQAGGTSGTSVKFFEKITMPVYALVTLFAAKGPARTDALTGHG